MSFYGISNRQFILIYCLFCIRKDLMLFIAYFVHNNNFSVIY